jgi:hypothetical protein
MRLSAGLQGAVVGGCAALAVWVVALLAARWASPVPGSLAPALAAGLVALGALVAGLRRITPVECARAIDRAAGDDRNGDRTLAATSLMNDATAQGPFVDAAIEDAARAARGMALASAAPLRRPRGLAVAGALGGVIVVASLWPVSRAPASLAPVSRAAKPARPDLRLDPATLAAERAAAEAAAQQAAALADPELARLAAELSRLLAALADGSLEQGEALERLARLEREAAQAADEGRAAAELLRAAADALDREQQTRALADALREADGGAGKRASDELGARAKEMSAGQREKLSQALGRAGAAGARTLESSAEGSRGEAQRRLAREDQGKEGGAGQASQERDRRLKRLDRDLSDAADLCREDPEACRQALSQVGEDLTEPAREARQSSSRDRLGRTTQQLRERLRRQGPRDGNERAAEESFERAAGGVQGQPSGMAQGSGQGSDNAQKGATGAEGRPSPSSAAGESAAASAGAAAASAGAGTTAGDGMGNDPGDAPLGAREAPTGARGEQREAQVRDGEGPSRAEVIEAGAHRGFARTEYQRVFEDYSAVVEETLDTTAVPAPRRYLVRRYFQLIRPRQTGGPTGGPRGR